MEKFISKPVDGAAISAIRIAADNRITVSGQERYGQAIFNAAFLIAPERANELRGTMYDPFYDDSRVDIFLRKMKE